ncbi:MAG TPA: class I SAM-dependent methyltransferase [Candidatus Lokiarchaeia archaeon]|nr:class I SAM-dependent methyltransferase [Candidatus Lokiarchaeia archaeon]
MMRDVNILQYNREAWDKEVERGTNDWTIPVSHDVIERARQGELNIYLTPRKMVPASWFPNLIGCETLCLASGGGQQAPLLAAAGANVTLVDLSPKQLDIDRQVADRENLTITTIQGDMGDLSMLADNAFDLIVHPVSNVFVPSVLPVWREAARVLKDGGIMLASFANPVVYLFDSKHLEKNRLVVSHKIPYSPYNDDARAETEVLLRHSSPLEFGHTLQDQIGGQTDAGFAITGFYEDNNRDNVYSKLDDLIPIYIATRAIKRGPGQ